MAEIKEIRVPDIGDFDAVEVIEVLAAPGDQIGAEDPLVTLESDKATMDVPAPLDGTITEIKISVGDKVSEGSLIALIEVAETAQEPVKEPEPEPEPVVVEEPAPEVQAVASAPMPEIKHSPPSSLPKAPRAETGRLPHASPSVRKFARELGAELAEIVGTGPKGRIVKADVKAYVKGALAGGGGGLPFSLPPAPQIDFSKFGETEVQPLGRIQKISGPHLHRAWISVPHVTQFDEADITDLEALRTALKPEATHHGVKVTPLPMIMKAVVGALKEFPEFCASLDPAGQNLILKKYYNIGVAVDTPGGLVVPVIKDVDKKGVFQLASELMDISQKARDGKLGPADLSGGCFTISSLGGIGGTAFTPIINAPEVAILGLSRSQMKPIWNGDDFEARLMLPLSLSYDHRVIDGAAGARFIVYLSQALKEIKDIQLWQN